MMIEMMMGIMIIILSCLALTWYRRPRKSPWRTIWPARWSAGRRRKWSRITQRGMNVEYTVACKPPNHSALSLVSNIARSYLNGFMKALSLVYSITEGLRDIFCVGLGVAKG